MLYSGADRDNAKSGTDHKMKKSDPQDDGRMLARGESGEEKAAKSQSRGSGEKKAPSETLGGAHPVPTNSLDSGNVPPLREDYSWLIENIAEASKNARKIYFFYIGFLAYCALTVVGTSDRQIIFNDTARLPIVNLEVSLNGFFIIAPLLAISIFVYFQLYLYRLKGLNTDLYENYGTVPKRRLYPWMVNIAENPEEGVIGRLQVLVVKFSLWWTLPIVLMLFSLWIVKKHSTTLSYSLGLFTCFGTVVVLFFWNKYQHSKIFEKVLLVSIVVIFEICLLFFLIPWAKEGIPWTKEEVIGTEDQSNARVESLIEYVKRWTDVDLSYQKLITEPEEDYGELYWVYFRGIHLGGAQLQSTVLKRAFLRDTVMEKANLNFANLEEADLAGANLQAARLESATLKKANFEGANLKKVSFISARLEGANLSAADLRASILVDAYLTGSALASADLQRADLTIARLRRASLAGAQLQNAILQGADLKDANLARANLAGANLQAANLEGANLEGTNLKGAIGLSVQQLCRTLTLYQCQLEPPIMEKIEGDCADLLEKPSHGK